MDARVDHRRCKAACEAHLQLPPLNAGLDPSQLRCMHLCLGRLSDPTGKAMRSLAKVLGTSDLDFFRAGDHLRPSLPHFRKYRQDATSSSSWRSRLASRQFYLPRAELWLCVDQEENFAVKRGM